MEWEKKKYEKQKNKPYTVVGANKIKQTKTKTFDWKYILCSFFYYPNTLRSTVIIGLIMLYFWMNLI
jgi:hypothetical protein